MRIVCNKHLGFPAESRRAWSPPERSVTYVILLIDIGNSRVKWATFREGKLGPQGAAAHGSWSEADWRREIEQSGATRVLVASVADPARNELLMAACRETIGRPPEFASSTDDGGGRAERLFEPGAAGRRSLAGRHWRLPPASGRLLRRRRGTALTIDGVDATGQHLGGFIVPGPRLMVESLLTGTSDLADRWAWGARPTRPAFRRIPVTRSSRGA